MSRTHRKNDNEHYGRFHRVRKDYEHRQDELDRNMKNELDDSVFEGDEDIELDPEELAAIEDAYDDDFEEDDEDDD